MAISYDAKQRIFSLHTKNTTYQMQIDRFSCLLHLYYGKANPGFIDTPILYLDRSFSGNPHMAGTDKTYSLDTLPQEYPTLGPGDYRHCALNIQNSDGAEYCALYYKSHNITKGKYSIKGLPSLHASEDEADTLEIILRDPVSGIEVSLMYGVVSDLDVITRCAVIRNEGDEPVVIKKAASATLDFFPGYYDLITLYGRHAMERKVERKNVSHGTHSIGSRRGTSSHEYNPAVMLTRSETSESAGDCYGMVFVYSGNFLCEAEKDQFDQVRLTMGLNNELFSYPLAPGEEFHTPEVILSFSGNGTAVLSQQYHKCIRENVCQSKYANERRPVVINSWEANYFDISADAIVSLAKSAAELGIDMVVMDDGWFGSRNDENSSLGDWNVNYKKLGEPLRSLAEKVNSYGVKFGIWIEPEMVSEDSTLYREHPDWVIRIKNRPPTRGRNQLVLDFSREEVRDHIFKQICAVLDDANIDYIKWDMNRSISDVNSGTLTYNYMLGVYDFLEKLTQRYPNILIEGCSGGGGRFDAGMLYYTPQIWCSDNTDAINRIKIQYGTSFFYPMSSIASHVSAVPNHQTGRVTRLETRGVVAMTGAFGYELDPAKLSPEERDEIREQVKTFKKYEMLISNGKYYRLLDPFRSRVAAWESVSDDKNCALLSAVYLASEANMPAYYIRMKGLDPESYYKEDKSGKIFTGAILMEAGYPIPLPTYDYEACQIFFKKVEAETAEEE